MLVCAGLFGIYATAQHNEIGNMLHIMSLELVDLTGYSSPIEQEEFDRAKNQLRSGVYSFIHPFACSLGSEPDAECLHLRHLHEPGAASGVV
jgi:hypothetical protein